MSRKKNTPNMTETVASVLGGLAGGLLGAYLTRVGQRSKLVAAGVTAAGGIGMLTLRGPWRHAAGGAAAFGAGQLALAFLEPEPNVDPELPEAGQRNDGLLAALSSAESAPANDGAAADERPIREELLADDVAIEDLAIARATEIDQFRNAPPAAPSSSDNRSPRPATRAFRWLHGLPKIAIIGGFAVGLWAMLRVVA